MHPLPPLSLPSPAQQQLDEYQREIDMLAAYAARVLAAKELFSRYNVTTNSTFRQIRATLTALCAGERRCMYCEDSCADEVEHFKPKDLYPDSAFRWENYLYVCGPCNTRKGSRFAVIAEETGVFEIVTRTKKKRDQDQEVPGPPKPGRVALLDPRSENPFEYMEMDLLDTFFFQPTGPEGSIEYRRAEFTIQSIGLNRDVLPRARRSAFGSYRAHLHEYISRRDDPKQTPAEVGNLIASFQRLHHRAVWYEIKRYHTDHATQGLRQPQIDLGFSNLFAQAEEALRW